MINTTNNKDITHPAFLALEGCCIFAPHFEQNAPPLGIICLHTGQVAIGNGGYSQNKGVFVINQFSIF